MNKKGMFFSVVGGIVFGFFAGSVNTPPQEMPIERRTIRPEISIVEFQKISGDTLKGEISGPARLLWGGENMVEGDGEFQIPLGQVPNENGIKLQLFPYTGNAKTGKFYPSDSYFARGTEVRHRRFFRTKQAAMEAGFIPTKGVE
ncbi:hypothetical protein K9L63_01970 [Candidatus Gracilibacteria bacterium]|nr:hypothetical protein [Candidatus Gracilibacteria bacterium]